MGKARIIITFVRLCIALLLIISMCEVSFASTASQVVSSMFPLTPNQIDEVKSEIKSRQQAAATPPSMNNTTGVSRILVANTQPGFSFAPPNIRLGIGVVTTVIFTNTKGVIWPVTSFIIGDKENFNVTFNKANGILMLQSLKAYTNTNMAVMLKGRKTPVTVMLLSTQKKWDYEVYIRVLSAKDNHFDIKGSTYLIDLLSGIAPSGAKRLSLSANSMNARLWEYHGNYLLLTRSVLISPSYIHHIEDNTLGQINVYEIAKTPVIILSGGKGMQKVMVKDDS